MNIKEELEKIPEYNNHFIYHWRNNRDRTMDVDYFMGYKMGADTGVYKHPTKRQLQELTDDDVTAMITGFKEFLRGLKSEKVDDEEG